MPRTCPSCGGSFPRWGITTDCPLCDAPLVTDEFRRTVPALRVVAGAVLVAIVLLLLYLLVWAVVGG